MFAIDYHDRGTPASPRLALVTVEIDGTRIEVREGTSIMRAASLVNRDVPKLCATDSLKSFGSCRLCLVEIEGRRGYPASCTTPVTEGMKVRTQSEKLTQLRRGVLELYVSDHPLDCVTCPGNGHCELQDMAELHGLTESRYGLNDSHDAPAPVTLAATRYGLDGVSHQHASVDTSNP